MAFLPADFMFHSHDQDDHSPSTSLNILPPYPPHDFHGVGPFHMTRSMSFNSGVKMFDNHQEQVAAAIMHGDMDELSDDEGSQAGDHNSKKKRLNLEQVKALEKSFDLGNKLEPERKMQLARALNLQPRQVAIWFQNRRARWKTKQLERDYDLLKKQFEAVKADNDALHAQNKKLHAELLALRNGEPTRIEGININKKETEGSLSNGSENSSDHHVNLDMSRTPVMNNTQLSCKQLFPSSFIRPTSITQLLQSSTRSDLQCPKIDQIIQDESFCNMFCGIDDQSGSGIWPWPEQNQFQ